MYLNLLDVPIYLLDKRNIQMLSIFTMMAVDEFEIETYFFVINAELIITVYIILIR